MRADFTLTVIVGGFLGVSVWVWGLERGEVTSEEGDVVTLDKFLDTDMSDPLPVKWE